MPNHSNDLTTNNASLEAVTVILVTYHSTPCLKSLTTTLQACPHLIIVDNHSQDNIEDVVDELLPHAQLLMLPKNMGFGYANNRALERVTTPYALLLNPDCGIEVNDIVGLVKVAQRYDDAAIVAPQLVDELSKPTLNYHWVDKLWRSGGPVATGECCVGFATGAVYLINRANTLDTPYFDESYFLYSEDVDLCWQYFFAKKSVIIAPQIVVSHASRGSVHSGRRARQEFWRGYHHAQSKVHFHHKHYGAATAKRVWLRMLVGGFALMVVRAVSLNFRLAGRMAGRFFGMLRCAATVF